MSAPWSDKLKKLNQWDHRHLKRYIKSNRVCRREPLADISAHLNLNVSARTIHRELKDLGMRHRIQRERPWLSPKQKAARLKFALNHIHWSDEEWERVIFTDEMALQTGANEGDVWVWRYPEEEYKEDCCDVTHKSDFKKIKVWNAMWANTFSSLVLLLNNEENGWFTSKKYCDQILNKELFDFWQKSMKKLEDVLIMKDEASYH